MKTSQKLQFCLTQKKKDFKDFMTILKEKERLTDERLLRETPLCGVLTKNFTMSHQIDTSKGAPAFVSFQEPAWHGLGKTMKNVLTVNDALKEGGLDFTVKKEPNTHVIKGHYITSEESFFTYRTDVNKVLGDKLGKDYVVYQNHEALAIVDELLKTKKCSIETAGSLDEGKKVFVCLKLTSKIIITPKDAVEQYVLLVNSHDGRIAITALETNIRVVCNNTLSAALAGSKDQYKVRHTRNAVDRVKEAFTIMGLLGQNHDRNEAAYKSMKENVISRQEFYDYIGNVFFTEEEIKELQKGEKDAISTRKKKIIESVFNFAESGIGQQEALGKKLNMWYAYNAVTGATTLKKYSSENDRFNSLIFGDSANKIKLAGDLAIHPDRIQKLKLKDPLSKIIMN